MAAPARRLMIAALSVVAGFMAGGAAADNSGGLLPVPSATIARGERITADMLSEKHFYFDPGRPLAVITSPDG